ncbi:MAG: hypothetical protein WC429_19895 [Verrucomicrobiia bacterium]
MDCGLRARPAHITNNIASGGRSTSRAGFDRHQTLLLPESLDDYVVPEHPVRFIDAFVASLNLAALGFRHATVKDTGRLPYDPADLLRLDLYGYLHRIRSSAAFRKDNARPLRAVGGQLRWPPAARNKSA